jgi:hypothetical protein
MRTSFHQSTFHQSLFQPTASSGGLVVMRWPVIGTKGGMFLLPTMARQLARLLTQAADDLESLT